METEPQDHYDAISREARIASMLREHRPSGQWVEQAAWSRKSLREQVQAYKQAHAIEYRAAAALKPVEKPKELPFTGLDYLAALTLVLGVYFIPAIIMDKFHVTTMEGVWAFAWCIFGMVGIMEEFDNSLGMLILLWVMPAYVALGPLVYFFARSSRPG